MMSINGDTSLEELAALVSQVLEGAGITATLSGGGAVVLYTENEYESCDLDFITSARTAAIAEAMSALGFHRVTGVRQFEHPRTDYYVEFPSGPLAFGETVIPDADAATLQTDYGPVRIVTPTHIVMDRLAAYVHWSDGQSWDQAIMVGRRHALDWDAMREWAAREGIARSLIDGLRTRVTEADR